MSDEESLRELVSEAATAAAAAPAKPDGAHLGDEDLARLRAGEDDESLDGAYRHVASCAVCRARMTDAEAGKALVASVLTPAPAPALAPAPVSLAARRRVVGWWVAAAAAVLLISVFALRSPRHTAPLSITQRAFTGTMGTSPSPSSSSLPASDRNVELTLDDDVEAASAIACDAEGRRLFDAQPFARDARGKLVLVLAPRVFAVHAGPVRMWVFAGSSIALRELFGELGSGLLVESTVRVLAAEKGLRLTVVVLAE